MKQSDYNDPWYERYHRPNETSEFVEWYVREFGFPEKVGFREYWVRRSRALAAWNERKRRK